jgi:hypothetical protein
MWGMQLYEKKDKPLMGHYTGTNMNCRLGTLKVYTVTLVYSFAKYVKTRNETSSAIVINTGGPQGCVLSAFLFIIYTNAMAMNGKTCKIIKYADDTIIVGLVDNNDETDYRNAINYVKGWCLENYLELNITKTKELVFDFRRNQNPKHPVNIDGRDVDFENKYKYLGLILQDNLKWDSHIEYITKKANKRMYHVRCLRNLQVDNKIMCMFYNSVISSVLVYAISCWYNGCSKKLKKDVGKFRKRMCKMISEESHNTVDTPSMIYKNICISLVRKILEDVAHPLHDYFIPLPHRKRLRMPRCKTSRYQDTFVPSAVKMYNM